MLRLRAVGWPQFLLLALASASLIHIVTDGIAAAAAPRMPDLMFLLNATTCLIALYLSLDANTRMHRVIVELRDNSAIQATDAQMERLHQEIDSRATAQQKAGMIMVGVGGGLSIIIGSFLVPWLAGHSEWTGSIAGGDLSFGARNASELLALFPAVTIAAVIAGRRLGELSAYGSIRDSIRRARASIYAQGSGELGGLDSLIDFLRRQAALTLIPVGVLATNLILTSFDPFLANFGDWRLPIMGLFTLAVFYAWRGFMIPTRTMTKIADDLEARSQSLAPEAQIAVRAIATAVRRRLPLRPSTLAWLLSLMVVAVLAGLIFLPVSVFFFGPRAQR